MFTALCIAPLISGADSNSQPAPLETLIIALRGASAYDGANDPRPQPSQLLQSARELELAVHPFTLRQEDLPDRYSLPRLLQLFIHDFRIEGVFTDHPDQAFQARQLSR